FGAVEGRVVEIGDVPGCIDGLADLGRAVHTGAVEVLEAKPDGIGVAVASAAASHRVLRLIALPRGHVAARWWTDRHMRGRCADVFANELAQDEHPALGGR